jgi:hypothetical protein
LNSLFILVGSKQVYKFRMWAFHHKVKTKRLEQDLFCLEYYCLTLLYLLKDNKPQGSDLR